MPSADPVSAHASGRAELGHEPFSGRPGCCFILLCQGGGKLAFALPPNAFQQMVEIVDDWKRRVGERPEGTAIN